MTSNMPPEMHQLWAELFNELNFLRLKWQNYRTLFSNRDTVELLNKTAGSFFGMCQQVFLDDAITTLCRVTDPKRSCGHDNVSLERLMEELDVSAHPTLAAEAKKALDGIEQRVDVMRTQRNKRIAHNDFETALDPSNNPIPGISRQNITDTLDAIHDFLDLFDSHFNQSSTAKTISGAWDGADKLIRYLDRAQKLREQGNFEFVMGRPRMASNET